VYYKATMVKEKLKEFIDKISGNVDFDILTPPDPKFGDYSINLPFVLGKKEKRNPTDAGREVLEKLSADKELKKYFGKIEFALPGFINFHLSDDFIKNNLKEIAEKGEDYGSGDNKNCRVNLEFVSANPTGPLMVHNMRGGPFGDTLGNIFKKAGYEVTKEYYFNDVGVQTMLLGESVAKRLQELNGIKIEFGENLYPGEYIREIAGEINSKKLIDSGQDFDTLLKFCRDYALEKMIESIKRSMEELGVSYDVWFRESSLQKSGEIDDAMAKISEHTYEKDGARWFRVSNFFPEQKDAVVVKSEDRGVSYLMGDIAYTRNKIEERGFNKAINIWGTDHHGDVPRLLAGAQALGYGGKLEILLHQLVTIMESGEKQRMSKRAGKFFPVDELLAKVGKDAIRFFFLAKSLDTHMEFDVDLAKEESKRNPVYYIQYAYARLNQIFEKIEKDNSEEGDAGLLKEPEEKALMRRMAKYPELIEDISKNYQVHHLTQYAYELASDFHNFYEKCRVIQDDKELQSARVYLSKTVSVVLGSVLSLMGLKAPKKM